MKNTDNLRIKAIRPLLTPASLDEKLPISPAILQLIEKKRQEARDIIHGRDSRLLVIVGPCSIHDPIAALDYARQLKHLSEQFSDELCVVMRVYFEKPRTTIGWKGLINDPDLNETFNINKGITLARQLLLDINALGMPTGTEFLDTTIPQYIADLITWSAIGARTTESQIHRELASGLSMPVGFKNGTTGDINIAADAVSSVSHRHHFLGVSKQGLAAIVSTDGNPNGHIILRGAKNTTNYDEQSIQEAINVLKGKQLNPRLMVDCSHGNSNKDHKKQIIVVESLCQQIKNGNSNIFGCMIESNITEGKQTLSPNTELHYGQSVTDACINLSETEKALDMLAKTVRQSRDKKKVPINE